MRNLLVFLDIQIPTSKTARKFAMFPILRYFKEEPEFVCYTFDNYGEDLGTFIVSGKNGVELIKEGHDIPHFTDYRIKSSRFNIVNITDCVGRIVLLGYSSPGSLRPFWVFRDEYSDTLIEVPLFEVNEMFVKSADPSKTYLESGII